MKINKGNIPTIIVLVCVAVLMAWASLQIYALLDNHTKETSHTQIIINESGPNMHIIHKNVRCPVCNQTTGVIITSQGLDNGVYIGYCKEDGTLFELT